MRGQSAVETLLEPVVGVRLVIERCNLAVSRRSVQVDRLGQGSVGLETGTCRASASGARFELAQEPPPEAESASRRGDPHALDLSGIAAVELESAATDRLIPQPGDQDQSSGFAEFVSIGRDAALRVESSLEPLVELREVRLEAIADRGSRGFVDPDRDEPGCEEPWVVNAYLLTLGSLILIGGSLGDIYGQRRIFALGVGSFGLASLLCALAPTIETLVAARALQGMTSAC